MDRKLRELVLNLELLTDEVIELGLEKRHCLVTGNRRTDICMLAYALSLEPSDSLDTLLMSYDNE